MIYQKPEMYVINFIPHKNKCVPCISDLLTPAPLLVWIPSITDVIGRILFLNPNLPVNPRFRLRLDDLLNPLHNVGC